MTSANAARALQARSCRIQLTSLPTFTVGRHTAEAARASGFVEVHCADGDRNDLAKLLGDRFGASHARVVYLCGENRAGDLAIAASALTVICVVYRMVKAEQFPELIQAALTQRNRWRNAFRSVAPKLMDCARHCGAMESALHPPGIVYQRKWRHHRGAWRWWNKDRPATG
jgi:hypothetical protein